MNRHFQKPSFLEGLRLQRRRVREMPAFSNQTAFVDFALSGQLNWLGIMLGDPFFIRGKGFSYVRDTLNIQDLRSLLRLVGEHNLDCEIHSALYGACQPPTLLVEISLKED